MPEVGQLLRNRAGDCSPACTYPEVMIGKDNASPLLPVGTRVLAPCAGCGSTPWDALHTADQDLANNQHAFARYLSAQLLPLYHWAPASRRGQIMRYGLRPRMRPTTALGDLQPGWRASYVCFADTPRWAWALSGGQRHAPAGEWDLWSTLMSRLTDPWVEPAHWANGIHEIRTEHRVFKRDLWLTATRHKA